MPALRSLSWLAALGGLALAARAAAPLPPLPTRLACQPDPNTRWALSRDGSGAPRQVSVSVTAGTRECDFASSGPPTALPEGGWRFDWQDEVLGQRQRVDVLQTGDGFLVRPQPAACGALRLPTAVTLAPRATGCAVAVDRDGAFEQFWQQLREALARQDGERLQQLSLPQLEFVDGPDLVQAPARVMRRAARCLPRVTATTRPIELRDLLKPEQAPRLDMPPLSRKGDSRIDVAGAMSLRWTAQGWRMDGFNTSPDVFEKCPAP